MMLAQLHNRFVAVLLLAVSLYAAGSVAVWAGETPEQVVQERARQVMETLRSRGAEFESNPGLLYDLVDKLVLPMIDFEAMAKLTLGQHWRQASAEQRQRFMREYRQLLVRTYTKSLLEVRDSKIEFLPNRNDPDSPYATVASEVIRGGGQPNLPVTYSLRKVDGHWLVYDVTIEGLSLIKNYRTSFNTQIGQVGLEAFLKDLEARNRQAKDGAEAPAS